MTKCGIENVLGRAEAPRGRTCANSVGRTAPLPGKERISHDLEFHLGVLRVDQRRRGGFWAVPDSLSWLRAPIEGALALLLSAASDDRQDGDHPGVPFALQGVSSGPKGGAQGITR